MVGVDYVGLGSVARGTHNQHAANPLSPVSLHSVVGRIMITPSLQTSTLTCLSSIFELLGSLEEFKLSEDAWLGEKWYNTLCCRMRHDPMHLQSYLVRVAHRLTCEESLVQAFANLKSGPCPHMPPQITSRFQFGVRSSHPGNQCCSKPSPPCGSHKPRFSN